VGLGNSCSYSCSYLHSCFSLSLAQHPLLAVHGAFQVAVGHEAEVDQEMGPNLEEEGSPADHVVVVVHRNQTGA